MKNSELDIQATVRAAFDDATSYIDSEIAPHREKAVKYYNGEHFGNEEDGRSQVVLTDLRDTINTIKPNLLRVFCSQEKTFEYIPRRPDAVMAAEQATDYVNYILHEQNNGYDLLSSLIHDALLNKTGVAKWYWDQRTVVTEETYEGLTLGQVQMVTADEEVEVISIEVEVGHDPNEAAEPNEGSDLEPHTIDVEMHLDPMTGMPAGEPLVTLRVRRTKTCGEARVVALPPEEFLIDRSARDIETAPYLAHRTMLRVSDLVSMGYPLDVVQEHAGSENTLGTTNMEELARNPTLYNTSGGGTAEGGDPSMRHVLYVEHFVRLDSDGDGIAELHRICTIGNACEVLHDEIVSEAPFATFTPYRIPHLVIGESVADHLMDLQLIRSVILRNTLDSMAQSIHPRMVLVEGQVNLDDAMNVEMGAIIRAKAPGMIQPLETNFLGGSALQLLGLLDDVKASRTGITRASQGLDPDVLQSTTKAAVTATTEAASQRMEMIARNLAEGLRVLAKGLLRLICRHQDKELMVRLRRDFVEVDPRTWDADMDVSVAVGLGRGDDATKMSFLTTVAQKQSEIIQQYGPQNPIVGLVEFRNTLAQIMTYAGFKDSTRYFKQVDPNWQPPQQAPKPSPEEMLAQAQVQSAQMQAQTAMAKVELEARRADMEHEREMEKMRLDAALKVAEMNAKYSTQYNVAQIEAQADAMSAQHQATAGAISQVVQKALQNKHDAAMAQQEAAAMQAQQPPLPPGSGYEGSY